MTRRRGAALAAAVAAAAVAAVLAASTGLAWETIIDQWHSSITKDAIAEAVSMANQVRSRRQFINRCGA